MESATKTPHISQKPIRGAGEERIMPGSYPVTFTCVLWFAHLHSQAHHTLKINASLKYVKMGKLRQEKGK